MSDISPKQDKFLILNVLSLDYIMILDQKTLWSHGTCFGKCQPEFLGVVTQTISFC